MLVSGHGKLRSEVLARAAALDVEHRFRLMDESMAGSLDLAALADMLAAMDALLVLPIPALACLAPFDRMIECGQSHAIPVICAAVPGLIEVAGAGGWTIPAGDTGALFNLVRQLARNPGLIEARRSPALQQSTRRASASVDFDHLLSTVSGALPPRLAQSALLQGALGAKFTP